MANPDSSGEGRSVKWGAIALLLVVALLAGYVAVDEFRVRRNRDLIHHLRQRIIDNGLNLEGVEAERKALGESLEWSTESLGSKAVRVAMTPRTGYFGVQDTLNIECEGTQPCIAFEVQESGSAF